MNAKQAIDILEETIQLIKGPLETYEECEAIKMGIAALREQTISKNVLTDTINALTNIVCAFAEISGMNAENAQRQLMGESIAYSDESYQKVIDRYNLNKR